MHVGRGAKYGVKLAYDKNERARVKEGFNSGVKAVINSYTGSSREENITGKALTAGAGATKGGIKAYNDTKTATQNASSRVERYALEKSAKKTVVKAAVKGASKALGWIGFVPDVITFGKGFKRGYSSYGR